jgi:BlaI family penicillinase repressor
LAAMISYEELRRRERQIVEIVHRRREATAREIWDDLERDSSYSAVRSALRLLVGKGVLRYDYDGKRYVYRPVIAEKAAQRSALNHLIDTFFAGSASRALAAILSRSDVKVSEEELGELEALVEKARRKAGKR